MRADNLFTTEHIELVGIILFPLASGIGYLIWQQAQLTLKVDVMWQWLSNHKGNHDLIEMLDDRKGRKRT